MDLERTVVDILNFWERFITSMVTLALPFQYNTDKHGLASSWAELVDVIIVPLVQWQPTLGTSVFVSVFNDNIRDIPISHLVRCHLLFEESDRWWLYSPLRWHIGKLRQDFYLRDCFFEGQQFSCFIPWAVREFFSRRFVNDYKEEGGIFQTDRRGRGNDQRIEEVSIPIHYSRGSNIWF